MIVADDALLDLPMPQANEQILALALTQCSVCCSSSADLVWRPVASCATSWCATWASRPTPASSPANCRERQDATPAAVRGETSFRALLEDVRERFAEEFLADGMPVSEIAGRLGYQELSSFSQAFRRWKGVGPRDYRTMIAHAATALTTVGPSGINQPRPTSTTIRWRVQSWAFWTTWIRSWPRRRVRRHRRKSLEQ